MALNDIQDLPNPGTDPNQLTNWKNWKKVRSQFTGAYYTSNYASFSGLISDLGSRSVTVYVNSAVSITDNLTIPSNISLVVLAGGSFAISSGKTLTINGPYSGFLGQHFTGAGSVALNRVAAIYPQWWGAIGDTVTDDTAAMQAAIDATYAAGGGVVYLPKGTYRLTTYLTLKNNVDIIGESWKAILSCTGGFISASAKCPYIYIDNCSNVKIAGFKIDGTGSYAATPFANPYAAGNSVGFTNEDKGIQVGVSAGGSCGNIVIENMEITGVGRGIYTDGSVNVTNLHVRNNYIHNVGWGNNFSDCTGLFIHHNRISGVYGNQTAAGDTSTANSKYADGVYLDECLDFVVDGNIIDDIIRIGIVLENSALTLNKGGSISNNVIYNIHGHRGTEFNCGIWSELNKSTQPLAITGNVIYDSDQYGIQAVYVVITGGSIRGCGTGIVGQNFQANGVELIGNGLGADVAGAAGETIAFKSCKFINNLNGGLNLQASHGLHDITGNLFQDNGTTATTATLGLNYGIRVNRYYNDQQVLIRSNSFVSSANAVDASGQLYGIMSVSGGDFTRTTQYIEDNTFVFTGALAAYPSNINVTPVSYAYNNTAVMSPLDICGYLGNTNSKLAAPNLEQTHASGTPRFLGFASVAPVSGTYVAGDYLINTGVASGRPFCFICVTGGSPGTWQSFGWGPNATLGVISADQVDINTTGFSPAATKGQIYLNAVNSVDGGLQFNDRVTNGFSILQKQASLSRLTLDKSGTATDLLLNLALAINGAVYNSSYYLNLKDKAAAVTGGASAGWVAFGVGVPGDANIERVILQHLGASGAVLNSSASGTGVVRDLLLQTGGTTRLQLGTAGGTLTGDLKLSVVGKGLYIKPGTNGRINLANVLVAGTVVVANTSVTATTVFLLSVTTVGGTQGILSFVRNVGVGYTINSSNAADTSTVDVVLIEAA